jgi:hypothetical protein
MGSAAGSGLACFIPNLFNHVLVKKNCLFHTIFPESKNNFTASTLEPYNFVSAMGKLI